MKSPHVNRVCNHPTQRRPVDGGKCDANLIDIALFPDQISDRKSITIRTKVASVRYSRPIGGMPDFAPYSSRLWATIKGIEIAEEIKKTRPFNSELLRLDLPNLSTQGDIHRLAIFKEDFRGASS